MFSWAEPFLPFVRLSFSSGERRRIIGRGIQCPSAPFGPLLPHAAVGADSPARRSLPPRPRVLAPHWPVPRPPSSYFACLSPPASLHSPIPNGFLKTNVYKSVCVACTGPLSVRLKILCEVRKPVEPAKVKGGGSRRRLPFENNQRAVAGRSLYEIASVFHGLARRFRELAAMKWIRLTRSLYVKRGVFL